MSNSMVWPTDPPDLDQCTGRVSCACPRCEDAAEAAAEEQDAIEAERRESQRNPHGS